MPPLPPMQARRPRLVFADDHPFLEPAVRHYLGDRVELIRTVTSLPELDDVIHDPAEFEVLLLDLVFDADSALPRIMPYCRKRPALQILVMTGFEDARTCAEAFEAGAIGFIAKLSAHEDLRPALDAALRGERWVSPMVAAEHTAPFVEAATGPTRERRAVIRLKRQGMRNKAIAAMLHISVKAVEYHVTRSQWRREAHGT